MSNILHESARGIEVIPLDDQLLSNNNIFITGPICHETCNEIIKQLLYLNQKSDVDCINIYIDSTGGEVQSGLALYEFIRMLNKTTKTIVLASAYSMAAVLFMAGDERLMLKDSSRVMIHDPSFSNRNVAGLKSHEIQTELNELNKCRAKLAKIISERTGKSIKEVYKVTKDDTFFDAEEAISFGIATGIYRLDEGSE